jgi:hypothetical protein
VILLVAIFLLTLFAWALFELQRMPYNPPYDMTTFLGGNEIIFVRELIGLVGCGILSCAVALGVQLALNRRDVKASK